MQTPAAVTSLAPSVVFVVEDDVSVREALETLLCSAGLHVESFESAEEYLACEKLSGPGCLLLDIRLPRLSGLDLQTLIVQDGSSAAPPIIFITGFGDIPTTVRAMKAGAVEFLTKPLLDSAALLGAVESALEKSRAALVREAETRALFERYASLSSRERQVMWLVIRGTLNKQVGVCLGISEITVKSHRGRVMRKMMAESLADLVNMASKLEPHSTALIVEHSRAWQ